MSDNQNAKFFNEKMQLSPYNYDPRVTAGLHLPKELTLCDATLREGAQGSVIGFSLTEKIEILRRSAAAGVKLFQVGTTIQYSDIQQIMKVIQDEKLDIETEVMVAEANSDWRIPLDHAMDLGVTYIDIMGFFTPHAAAFNRGASAEQIIDNLGEQIAYVVSKGGRVSFDPMDGPRTDLDLLMKAYKVAVDAGAERVRILDSVGTASPATWRFLVSTVRNEFKDVKICIHCHNDYGQAMANVYTGIECGADMVDVCINGLGERAGNASLAEVAAGAEILYNVNTGIKLDKMYDLSSFVADVARQTLEKNKPIVGEWTFAHGDEGHHMMKHFAPWAFEGVKADVFGNEQKVVLGIMSGPYATKAKLATLGYQDVSDEAALKIFGEIRCETVVRKAILKDESIKKIVTKYI